MANTIAPMTKRKMIESQSSNGKCYVRLITSLPSYKNCRPIHLEDAIVTMTNNLGQNPLGLNILGELPLIDRVLRGLDYVPNLAEEADLVDTSISGVFASRLMSSGVRYSWEEISGVHHIGSYLEGDNCSEVYCEHGWAARFVFCMIVGDGIHVGANDDEIDTFAQFLGEWQEEVEYKKADKSRELEELTEKIKFLRTEVSNEASESKEGSQDRVVGDIAELLSSKYKQDKMFEESVMPLDSSSQIGRYKNRYMKQGTVYDMEKRGKTVLSVLEEHDNALNQIPGSPSKPYNNVAVGYLKTKKLAEAEARSLVKIHPINGLANPFRSDRLNLLMHFHTAIDNIQPKSKDSQPSCYDAIRFLATFEALTPSEELANQMIIRTFDLKSNRVIANPFKLPFLEIGMLMSDNSLEQSLDLLRLEYKTLWFENMKSLHVPIFHSSYRTRKEHKLSSSLTLNSSAKRSKDKSKPSSLLIFSRT